MLINNFKIYTLRQFTMHENFYFIDIFTLLRILHIPILTFTYKKYRAMKSWTDSLVFKRNLMLIEKVFIFLRKSLRYVFQPTVIL